jgi:hypothetical protein
VTVIGEILRSLRLESGLSLRDVKDWSKRLAATWHLCTLSQCPSSLGSGVCELFSDSAGMGGRQGDVVEPIRLRSANLVDVAAEKFPFVSVPIR